MGIILLWPKGVEPLSMFPCGNASSQCVLKSHIGVTSTTCQCFVNVGVVIKVQTHQVIFGVTTNFHISNSTFTHLNLAFAPLHSKLVYPNYQPLYKLPKNLINHLQNIERQKHIKKRNFFVQNVQL